MRKKIKFLLQMIVVFVLVIHVVSFAAELPYDLCSETGLSVNILKKYGDRYVIARSELKLQSRDCSVPLRSARKDVYLIAITGSLQ